MRPNILLVLTDQQNADALSCAGNEHLATPAADALAARGTRYPRAYCAQPLCTPSRAAMLTGRMPSAVGVTRNAGRLSTTDLAGSLGPLFSGAGYDCGYAGKWHLPEFAVPDGVGFTRVHGESEHGLVEACAEFLVAHRNQPYLLVASLTEPHGICQWARGQRPPSGDVSDVDSTRWPPLPANHPAAPYEAELPRIAQRAHPYAYPTAGWDADHWRRYLYAYHRLVERADAQLGGLLAALDASGTADDTVVLCTADHGDGAAAHGWNQKWVLHEEPLRVPLIVAAPGDRGAVDDRLVPVGLDLLPTLCDVAGVPTPAGLAGYSLRGTARHEQVVAETEWEIPGVPHLTGRMVRTERYKYTCYAWGRHREQLVDLAADPDEMVNLAPVGSHATVLDEHRRRLAAHTGAVGDPFARFVPTPGAPAH